MPVRIEDAGGGNYRGVYGFPREKRWADPVFASLDEALSWANTGAGGVLLIAPEE